MRLQPLLLLLLRRLRIPPPPRLSPCISNLALTRRANSTAPPKSTAPPPLSPVSAALRQTMRLLPHPVIILTAPAPPTSSSPTSTSTSTTSTSSNAPTSTSSTSASANSTPPPGVGITLSTLTCLSLSPHPLITFNIKTPSRTSAAMHSTHTFTAHILSPSPHSAHLANAFAQLGAGAAGKRDVWAEIDGGGRVRDERGVPVLGVQEGVLTRLVCETETVVTVADHEIWVGRVVRVEGVGAGGEVQEGVYGLMYANRRFRKVGGEVRAEFGRGEEEDGSVGGEIV
ncbi:flavin reductase like domain-containing protein [Geopyxis carbonaria]|nr:flavin reductase like domain-containing protein [Geopyxis carbonaria]